MLLDSASGFQFQSHAGTIQILITGEGEGVIYVKTSEERRWVILSSRSIMEWASNFVNVTKNGHIYIYIYI